MQNIELNVEGMRCNGCEKRIKTVLLAVDGVKSVEADFKKKKVCVSADDSVEIVTLTEKIEDLGFEAIQK